MKDRTKASASSPASEGVKVYDLTPEMALPDQDKHKIINLINTIDNTNAGPGAESTEPTQVKKTEPPVVETQQPVSPAPEPEPEASSTTKAIEEEVDAAFKAAEALDSKEDNQLLDDMTNLTALVDHAIKDSADPTQTEEDLLPSDEAEGLLEADLEADNEAADAPPLAEFDEGQLAADAAALESALSAENEMGDGGTLSDLAYPDKLEESDAADDIQMDEEIIDLLDIADSEEAAAAETGLPDEEIIELTEMVERAEKTDTDLLPTDETVIELTEVVVSTELETSPPETISVDDRDDDIIELTEIIDPDEFAAATGQNPGEEIIELTEIVDPAELEATTAQNPDEAIIELTEIVDPDELADLSRDEDADGIIELTDILDPQNKPSDTAGLDEDEQLIRLSDVLNPKKGADEAPTE